MPKKTEPKKKYESIPKGPETPFIRAHLSEIEANLTEYMIDETLEVRKRIMAAIQALFDWEEEYGELVS